MNPYTALHGAFAAAPAWTLLAAVLGALALGYASAPLWVWTAAAALLLIGFGAPGWLLGAFAVAAALFNLPALRRALVSEPLMKLFKALNFLPAISETERVALEAGTVWVDGELFSGKPDFARLAKEPYPELSAAERDFLDGPVEEVCALVHDWEVWQRRDLSPEVWAALKKHGFFGLIIPKEYGGRGFSHSGNSAVVAKCSSRSTALGVTVMVPNSLGPAELLIHYGTAAQKDYYLPRLASGELLPAFALTEPGAGSDAGSIQASGVVFRDGDGQLKLRLNWEKRYITLAGVAGVLGLAFKLRDPDKLLGKGSDPGITCALIPAQAPGVDMSRRHDPLGVPFWNCPTSGRDVIVPVDAIIGGADGAGHGWRMLVESLAAGRGVSLPASSTAGCKMAARVTGAYAAIRQQFGTNIGKFEGIEEPLARIGGRAYILEAARRYTLGGLDTGAKPAVVTAIAKYNFTEQFRKSLNDGMDVLAGAGVSRGPRNGMASGYIGMPISITVEGANILTRTLMIFGQGAIRCHPYAYRQIKALELGDVKAFDAALFGHLGHVLRNACRSVVLSVTRGRLARSPAFGPAERYYRKLAWSSASFAFLADVAMALYGGSLKRKETVTGRFSDVFSWMYLANAVLRRFEAEGRNAEDLPFFHWSMDYCFARVQEGFDGIYRNFDVSALGWLFRGPVAWWSRLNPIGSEPSDQLGHRVAQALQRPGAARDRLTAGMYLPVDDPGEPLGRLERALRLIHEAEAVADKIKAGIRARKLHKARPLQLLDQAVLAGVISAEEAELVREAEAARWDAIQVDSFTQEQYMATALEGGWPGTPSYRGPRAAGRSYAGHMEFGEVGETAGV